MAAEPYLPLQTSVMPSASRGAFDTVVRVNTPLCDEHVRLTLGMAAFPASTAGQFLQIACRDDDDDQSPAELDWPAFGRAGEDAGPMLRRPFSLAGRRETADGVELDVLVRTVGVGTRFLAGLRAGDRVSVLGPLGRGFVMPPAGGLALLVGGGVGIPPMLYLADQLARASADPSVRATRGVAFCGTLSRRLLPLTITADAPPPAIDRVAPLYNIAEFAAHGVPAVITTDDGSYGFKGFVTDALVDYLDRWITDQADRARAVVYACGPEPMLRRVAEIARRRQIACQVCVERVMACGLGTCQSCCLRVKKPDAGVPPMAGSDWCYRLACTDGPVFDAETLLW